MSVNCWQSSPRADYLCLRNAGSYDLLAHPDRPFTRFNLQLTFVLKRR